MFIFKSNGRYGGDDQRILPTTEKQCETFVTLEGKIHKYDFLINEKINYLSSDCNLV